MKIEDACAMKSAKTKYTVCRNYFIALCNKPLWSEKNLCHIVYILNFMMFINCHILDEKERSSQFPIIYKIYSTTIFVNWKPISYHKP